MNPFRRLNTVARSVETVAQIDVEAVALDLRAAAQDHADEMRKIAYAVKVVAFVATTAILYHLLKDVLGVD